MVGVVEFVLGGAARSMKKKGSDLVVGRVELLERASEGTFGYGGKGL